MSSENLQAVRATFEQSGVRAALMFLNSLTGHRFTALYRFDDQTLKNLYFFDRQKPELDSCPEIPVLNSYCVFVRSSGHNFATCDSMSDERVRNHPKRLEVRSYCGVPLIDEDGKMFGTICHFDFEPRGISDDNIALMEALAQRIKPGKALARDR